MKWFYKEEAVVVSTFYRYFDGQLPKWKESFYEVWRYQMTWDFAYNIDLMDTHDGVKLQMIVKPQYTQKLVEVMESLGYGKIETEKANIYTVNSIDHDEIFEDNIRDIVIE